MITLITRNRPGLPYDTLINRLTPCKPQTCRAFLCMHRRGSCGVFFCLSVLCHNRGCEAVSAAAGHCSGAWPPPHYSECERNAPCTNRRNCTGGVFRSQAARPEYNKGTALVLVLRATTRENGAFYGNRPTGNAGKSMGSEIRIDKLEFYRLDK